MMGVTLAIRSLVMAVLFSTTDAEGMRGRDNIPSVDNNDEDVEVDCNSNCMARRRNDKMVYCLLFSNF